MVDERLQRLAPYGVFGQIREVPIMGATVITLPRRHREGSITDEQVIEAHDALMALEGEREAVQVCEGMESENSARNKARSLGDRVTEKYPDVKVSAHAIPDPNASGKFVGAISVKDENDEARDNRTIAELRDALTAAGYDPDTVQGTGKGTPAKVTRADYRNALANIPSDENDADEDEDDNPAA